MTSFPAGELVVTALGSTASWLAQAPCLSSNFFGTYRDRTSAYSIFSVSDPLCKVEVSEYTSYSKAIQAGFNLVWFEKVEVDSKLDHSLSDNTRHPIISVLNVLNSPSAYQAANPQIILPDLSEDPSLLYVSPGAALAALEPEKAKVVDKLLPPYWRSTLLPNTPVTHHTASPESIQTLKTILKGLKFDPLVAAVVNNISIPQIHNDIRFLTGEDPKSGIISRHSFSEGALVAANWLKNRVEDTGASCELVPFREGFAPNVICRYDAIYPTTETVLVSGHYDSRGSFGSTRAPGGDDDGSGTTGVLSIARTIGRKRVRFHRNVELAFFAGEEQGLVGSRAYAKALKDVEANLTLMIQADMTAYRAPGEPMQLGLPDYIGTPEVTQLVANISQIYSPELTVGITPACCSDHQSFWEQGFPSTQVFERAGPIADPMYHNSHDLSDREGYDFEQLFAIAKVQFAAILHVAGFELATQPDY